MLRQQHVDSEVVGGEATFQQQKQHGRQCNILVSLSLWSALRLAKEEEEEENNERDHDESVAVTKKAEAGGRKRKGGHRKQTSCN